MTFSLTLKTSECGGGASNYQFLTKITFDLLIVLIKRIFDKSEINYSTDN